MNGGPEKPVLLKGEWHEIETANPLHVAWLQQEHHVSHSVCVGLHVPEEVQHHPPDLHHQEYPGDAHARGLHPCQPHLCCRGNSFRKDQYRFYVMNIRKHRSSWNVHEPALNIKFVKIEKSLVKEST